MSQSFKFDLMASDPYFWGLEKVPDFFKKNV